MSLLTAVSRVNTNQRSVHKTKSLDNNKKRS